MSVESIGVLAWSSPVPKVFLKSRTHKSSPQWEEAAPIPAFAVMEGRKRLSRLSHATLSYRTRRQIDSFLTHVLDADSTVPSIVPAEDDTAVLHWMAGPTSIEVDIADSGPVYLWAALENGASETISDDATAIRQTAHRLVAEMAARVNRLNPGWRTQYLGR